MRLDALFRLAFASASPHGLTLPHTITRRLILQKARGHVDPKIQTLPRLVGTRFQVLFHSPPGVLFTFPSRYLSAIGHQVVFRLSGWSRQIHTGFLGPRATWDTNQKCSPFYLQGYYLLCRPFPWPSTTTNIYNFLQIRQKMQICPSTPKQQRLATITLFRFGLFRFRSPLLTE